MKRRWYIYIIVGILFGVFDFYFPNFLTYWRIDSRFWGNTVGFVLTVGLWLVSVVPIVLYEVKVSRSRILSTLANSLTWCIAVIVYYLTNVIQLAIGDSTQPYLGISNHREPSFWANWGTVLLTYILGHIIEWTLVAVIGGSMIGFLMSSIYLCLKAKKNKHLLSE
ncbi:hypothetical protein [Alicyclobacillus herbarius]|uniref:hypothetical protein n=1 Tax=Alicyclobacillus herbarius TaxID=122960 RepID=UPI000479C2D0|nr:hypothetical protein [Alicyclobacillus herbarius]